MIRKLSITVLSIGFFLHIHTFMFKIKEGFEFELSEFLFLSLLPYIICLTVFFTKQKSFMPFLGSAIPLFIDIITYYSVFINPKSSTDSLAFLWMPIWNTVFFVPLGFLFGYIIDRQLVAKQGNDTKEQNE